MGREKLLFFFLSRFAYLIIGANNRSTVYNLSQIRKKVVGKECSGFEKKKFNDKYTWSTDKKKSRSANFRSPKSGSVK